MQLTQKESTLLKDLRSQEQLCIDKYAKYSNEACDEQLKSLFSQIRQREQQHLQTLDQIASGTVPQMQAQGGGSQQPMQMQGGGSQQPMQAQGGGSQQSMQAQGGSSQQSMQAQGGSQQSGSQQGMNAQQGGSQQGMNAQQQSGSQQGMNAQQQSGSQQGMNAQQGGSQQGMNAQQGGSQQQSGSQQNMQFKPSNCSAQEKQKDAYLCSDALSTEKHVSSTYNTCIFEFSDSNVRNVLNHIQKEEQQHGDQIYKYMSANGMYC